MFAAAGGGGGVGAGEEGGVVGLDFGGAAGGLAIEVWGFVY